MWVVTPGKCQDIHKRALHVGLMKAYMVGLLLVNHITLICEAGHKIIKQFSPVQTCHIHGA